MKAPSKNVSQSLRGQSGKGRGAEQISVSKMKDSSKPSMTAPGTGGVERAPGMTHERSASAYTGPMSRFGGKS